MLTRELVELRNALGQVVDLFSSKGYSDTSMEDIVQATGVSRYGIYGDFGSKRGLFAAVFDVYQREVVSPAFARVEWPLSVRSPSP